ncbi:hypothetical protein [Lichenihabitans psoromatis]|nr:hypothetical protein [Lichenihabitans psoromatis]
MRSLRFYRVALGLSLGANVLLILGIWAYLHFEGVLSIIEEVVGIWG